MGNWIPNDPTSFVSQLLKTSAAFAPPPPEGFISPATWGLESHIVERFGQAGVPADRITMARDTGGSEKDRREHPVDLKARAPTETLIHSRDRANKSESP
jgi:hypothetical protein